MGLFSCNFAEPFFEVFATLDFFLGALRRPYACVVVVRNLDFLLFSTFDRSVTGTSNQKTVPLGQIEPFERSLLVSRNVCEEVGGK